MKTFVRLRFVSLFLFAFFCIPVLGFITNNLGGLGGKRQEIPAARVDLRLEADGSLDVTEAITFDFHGHFHGTYRDVVIPPGGQVQMVGVSEPGGPSWTSGASVVLGSDGDPNSWGAQPAQADSGTVERIVLHHDTQNRRRTFVLHYRVIGATIQLRDGVDLFWKAWGDGWDAELGQLQVQLQAPRPITRDNTRLWAHPGRVQAYVGAYQGTARLVAREVPARTFVELRALMPAGWAQGRAPLQGGSTDAAGVVEAERRDYQAAAGGRTTSGEQAAPSWWPNPPAARAADFPGPVPLLLGFLLGLPLGLLLLFVLYRLYGSNGTSPYDYWREPPGDLPPALAEALIKEDFGAASDRLFQSTLLDLIQRGYFQAQTVQNPDGGGDKVDLLLRVGNPDRSGLHQFEQTLCRIMDRVMAGSPVMSSKLPDLLKADQNQSVADFRELRSQAQELFEGGHVLEDHSGKRWVVGILALVVAVGLSLAGVWVALTLATAGLVVLCLAQPAALSRPEPEHSDLFHQWSAFQRFLADFPRLDQADERSLVLWERLLVYGVAFGLADQVLEVAKVRLPADAYSQSALYGVYGYNGYSTPYFLGDSFWVATQVATTPPPSDTSSGGGGGFSGGFGGGGFGGGGGGSW